ncbi:MAG TPA: hypothetical protein VK508_03015 [Cyclobacteriaceae bacterium]|nr:hypothetical protein [Cyclobacteriaceae bacterium]
MDSKVDKLFKEKLEAHTLQPSAQAWEKIESHLSKKNKMVVWLRIAAAIALLGLLTFAALNWGIYKTPKTELVKQEIKPQENPTIVPGEKKEEEKQVAEAPAPMKKQKPERVVAPVVPVEQEVAIVEEKINTSLTDRTDQELEKKQEPEKKAEKPITLVYSLPTIKKEAPAEPVVAETKKTGLERVLEIAKEVKNADNPLGDLRDAKDDIFAFEFRKDKDKTKKNN